MSLHMAGIGRPLAFFAVFWSSLAAAQDAGPTPLRCETYCSQTLLRTASARLTWVDPALRPSGAATPGAAAAAASASPRLDVTVVKNGFNTNAFATFLATEAGARPTAGPSAAAATPRRPYDLRVVGSVRPAISGSLTLEDAAPATERRETSLVIENLEPGIRYTWRLRFPTAAGEQLSAPATCVAPVCPADMKE
jgi:hypothetical protein